MSDIATLQDKLSEHRQTFSQTEIYMHIRSNSFEKNASDSHSMNMQMSEELHSKTRHTETLQHEYRHAEDKIRQSPSTISDNNKEHSIHLGELQETISTVRRGDATAQDNYKSYIRQEANTIALIRTEARA